MLLNAYLPMEVTLLGMAIEDSEVAPLNAWFPMETRVLPAVKVTVSSTLAFWNAAKPIEATLLGMIIEFRTDTSPAIVSGTNAASPIDVTVLGIVAVPAQFVLPVTTLSVIVNEPPVLQFTVAAHAGGATRVAPSRANTAVSDSLFAFNIIAPFL